MSEEVDFNVITVPEDTPPETVNDLVKDGWIVRLKHHNQSYSDSSDHSVSSSEESPRQGS